ncbi:hypothetical protein BGX26_001386 [Mortierella sp. AD094]|nr:hypothetical protein BGX26_001386 [Mortierella sp. AD094]
MKERIEKYFRDSGIVHDEVETLAHQYYVDYGLAIRGLAERHPEVSIPADSCSIPIDIRDYDAKVDGALPLETLLKENQALRSMIHSMDIGKKWLFTNAGENPDQKAFEKAMVQAGVLSPDLCYFVDDSAANIDMATKIGWTTVHVNEDPSGSALSGDFQIRSIMELRNVMPQFWDHRRGRL